MLSVPVKRTTDIKFRKSSESYIRKNYSKATVESVAPFMTDLDAARDRLLRGHNCTNEELPAYLNHLAIYYRYLRVIERPLPPGPLKLSFTWWDTLKNKKSSENTYNFERSNVLYNMGAVYTRLGAGVNLGTDEGSKLALNYFQVAAGCFEEARVITSEKRSRDMHDTRPEHLTMLINVCIGQGYISMYCKLDKNSASKANLSKLCISIGKNFGRAVELAESSALNGVLSDELRAILKCQCWGYTALSRYWQSFGDREEGAKLGKGFGIGVGRLKSASQLITKTQQLRALRGSHVDQCRQFNNMIQSERERAEKENMNVYMEAIAEGSALVETEELTMIKPKFPPLVDITSPVTGEECLQALVPPAVLSLIAEYKERLHQMAFEENEKVNNVKHEVNQTLGSMNLPQKIDALNASEGIPASMWNKIQQVQGQGGLNQLEQSIAALKAMGENNQKSLRELELMVQREEEEDNSFRNIHGHRWNRAPSSSANMHIKQEVNNYSGKLTQALGLDAESFAKWEDNRSTMQMLSLSKEELDLQVPSDEVAGRNESPSALALRDALNGLEEQETKLKDELTQLTSDMETENVIQEIMELEQSKVPKEPFFQREMAKYNPQRDNLFSLAGNIRGALDRVRSTNAEFDREMGIGTLNPQKVQFMQSLEQSVKLYWELSNTISQGQQFYNNLSRHLAVLQQKTSDFVYSRNLEKNELLGQLGGAPQQPGYGQPAYGQNPYGHSPYGHPQHK